MFKTYYRKILLKFKLRQFKLEAKRKDDFSNYRQVISLNCTNPHDFVSSPYAKEYLWTMKKNYEYVSPNQSDYFIYIITRIK